MLYYPGKQLQQGKMMSIIMSLQDETGKESKGNIISYQLLKLKVNFIDCFKHLA